MRRWVEVGELVKSDRGMAAPYDEESVVSDCCGVKRREGLKEDPKGFALSAGGLEADKTLRVWFWGVRRVEAPAVVPSCFSRGGPRRQTRGAEE